MRLAYVDTSALLAVLFEEAEAPSVVSALAASEVLYAANLVEAELRSVLHRERFDLAELASLLTTIQWLFPVRSLRSEFDQILACGYLRGADLWHLACALYLRENLAAPVLISCDQRQRDVARKLGLEALP
jgi:PIN domain nuclease of toxin-antitoxin system